MNRQYRATYPPSRDISYTRSFKSLVIAIILPIMPKLRIGQKKPGARMGIEDCKLIQFKKIEDPRGTLTPIEGGQDVPFAIKRAYYLYHVPEGAMRAGHAHKILEQIVIALCGHFDILVKDEKKSKRYSLNQPNVGLYIPNMVWREIEHFSAGAICFVLASQHYDESDYYRDYDTYLNACHPSHSLL